MVSTSVTRLAGLYIALLAVCLSSCSLTFGSPTPPVGESTTEATIEASQQPFAVWVTDGDLVAWHEGDAEPQVIAESGVIRAYLSPDDAKIAFTRGAEGEAATLWVVENDGTSAHEIVHRGDFPARGQGRPEIAQVAWLDAETLYFNTAQTTSAGKVDDENLFRVEIDHKPQVILPPGAGGDTFSISPDGNWIAVVHAGIYANDEGRISVLDPMGARVREALTFTAIADPSEPPITPPLTWDIANGLLRAPITDRETGLVQLWKIPLDAAPPNDEASIFGVVDALPDGLPTWGRNSLIYLQNSASATALVIADRERANARVYDTGHVSDLHWLADGDRFIYRKQDLLMLGRRGQAPRPLLEAPDGAITLAGNWMFFISEGDLHLVSLGGGEPQTIAPFPANTDLLAGNIS